MLTDLDDLILSVRDPASRSYIREAIIAHRAGAHRAAVISTWIAVLYDIIGKIRILDTQGEAAANGLVKELDNAVATENVRAMSNIEEKLLNVALNTFEFLNSQEHEDFKRIKADRNRCAHPAFSGEHSLFTPSPEVVRTHIVHAINHLLAHPPVQGRAAIKKIRIDVTGQYFPDEQDKVDEWLSGRYFNYAKPALVRELIYLFCRGLLRGDDAELTGHEPAVAKALVTISKLHAELYEARMREILPTLAEGLDDQSLPNLSILLGADARVWGWLDPPTRLRATQMFRGYQFGTGNDATVLSALTIAPLSEPLLEGLSQLDADEQLNIIAKNPRPELSELALSLFETSRSFRSAETRGRTVLLKQGQFFDASEIRRALKAVTSNGQIWDAAGMPSILVSFFDKSRAHLSQTGKDWSYLMNMLMHLHYGDADKFDYSELKSRLENIGLGPFEWDQEADEPEEGEKTEETDKR